jgi:recombination associated protein RdgC
MSFDRKRFPLTIFRLPAALPEDALERFAARASIKIDEVKAEPATGWVSGRHLLELRIDEETAIRAGRISVQLRTAQRKVPRALLLAECRMLELEYMQENRTDFVPRKVRREIRDNIEQARLQQMPPQVSAIPVLIDPVPRLLHAATTSAKGADLVVTWIHDTLGLIPIQLDPADLVPRLGKIDLEDLPPISFTPGAKAKENVSLPGRDFLTWLWFFSEEDGGKIKVKDHGEFAVAIDGPLTFALAEEAAGAAETSVRKGAPLRSAEAKAALTVGKKLRKARLLLSRGEEAWTMNVDADRFAFGGFAPPEGEQLDPASAFEEKALAMQAFAIYLEAAFQLFLERIAGPRRDAEQKRIRAWSEARDSC